MFLCLFLLTSCAPATQVTPPTEVITVYATPATGPWLTDLYTCANQLSVVLSFTSESPDIDLRIGEPEALLSPAYQIDQEEILIVTHRQSTVQNLSLEQAQALFTGHGDPSVQVWVYAQDEDVQLAFDQLVMKGRTVTSFARLATSPQQMSDVLNSESNSVGILPRHWKAGDSREVFSAGMVPVLAILQEPPAQTISELLTCLKR